MQVKFLTSLILMRGRVDETVKKPWGVVILTMDLQNTDARNVERIIENFGKISQRKYLQEKKYML